MSYNVLAGERLFKFRLTVPQIADSDGEGVVEAEMPAVLDKWLIDGGNISEIHKDFIVGKAIRWWERLVNGVTEYWARARINSGPMGDEAWEKIQRGEYKDVSIAGKNFLPKTFSDGMNKLNGLQITAVTLCPGGKHPFADITESMEVAKAVHSGNFVLKGEIVFDIEKEVQKLEVNNVVEEVKKEEPAVSPKAPAEQAPVSNYVTKDELMQFAAALKDQIIAEIKAPAAEVAETAKAEEEKKDEPKDEEKDKEVAKADLEKFKAELKAEVSAEVQKAMASRVVEKSETPKPAQGMSVQKKDDSLEALLSGRKINASDVLKAEGLN